MIALPRLLGISRGWKQYRQTDQPLARDTPSSVQTSGITGGKERRKERRKDRRKQKRENLSRKEEKWGKEIEGRAVCKLQKAWAAAAAAATAAGGPDHSTDAFVPHSLPLSLATSPP